MLDGPPLGKALLEVVPLQHPGDGGLRRQSDDPLGSERLPPSAVVVDDRPRRIEDLENLPLVRLGVLADLFLGERLARLGATGGIPDHPGEIPDQEDDFVPQRLELAQLVNNHGMPDVQIGSRRIKSQLHP